MATPGGADGIGTPQPLLEWWPVKFALRLVRRFVNYQVRAWLHKVLFPVRVILFLSGWPLVYCLRFLRWFFYALYRFCEFAYRQLDKSGTANAANFAKTSPPPPT